MYRDSESALRIRLLEQASRGLSKLPIALALCALFDENRQVRQWYARHAQILAYSPIELAECLEKQTPEFASCIPSIPDLKSEREFSLLKIVFDDPDPFVRACLRENPAFLCWLGAEEAFQSSNHMERLALLRNPYLAPPWGEKASGLLRCLFDPGDETLGISPDERKQLMLAYVANSNQKRYFSLDSVAGLENWETLNGLVERWGLGSGILPGCLDVRYPFVLGSDDVLAEFFPRCHDSKRKWRLLNAIEEGRSAPDYEKALAVAASDSDPDIREMAFRIWPFTVYSDCHTVQYSGPPDALLTKFLGWDDVATLKGLAQNATLSTQKHDKVLARLAELGVESDLKLTLSTERTKREKPLAGIELIFGRQEEWIDREFGTLSGVHANIFDLDRKLNLLAEMIQSAEAILIKDILNKRRWLVMVAILILTLAGLALLVLRFVL